MYKLINRIKALIFFLPTIWELDLGTMKKVQIYL